jgi:hypothetical protein
MLYSVTSDPQRPDPAAGRLCWIFAGRERTFIFFVNCDTHVMQVYSLDDVFNVFETEDWLLYAKTGADINANYRGGLNSRQTRCFVMREVNRR